MRRRRVLRLGLLAAAALAVGGHTPYPQWVVYRRRNLFIVAGRTDEAAVALARAAAAILAARLPASKAQATRATDVLRVGSLIATGQLDLAILTGAEAAALLDGSGPFATIGAAPLRTVFAFAAHLLVARDDFRARHAYLVAETLDRFRGELPGGVPVGAPMSAVPLHPGVAAYFDGLPPPTDEAAGDE